MWKEMDGERSSSANGRTRFQKFSGAHLLFMENCIRASYRILAAASFFLAPVASRFRGNDTPLMLFASAYLANSIYRASYLSFRTNLFRGDIFLLGENIFFLFKRRESWLRILSLSSNWVALALMKYSQRIINSLLRVKRFKY